MNAICVKSKLILIKFSHFFLLSLRRGKVAKPKSVSKVKHWQIESEELREIIKHLFAAQRHPNRIRVVLNHTFFLPSVLTAAYPWFHSSILYIHKHCEPLWVSFKWFVLVPSCCLLLTNSTKSYKTRNRGRKRIIDSRPNMCFLIRAFFSSPFQMEICERELKIKLKFYFYWLAIKKHRSTAISLCLENSRLCVCLWKCIPRTARTNDSTFVSPSGPSNTCAALVKMKSTNEYIHNASSIAVDVRIDTINTRTLSAHWFNNLKMLKQKKRKSCILIFIGVYIFVFLFHRSRCGKGDALLLFCRRQL